MDVFKAFPNAITTDWQIGSFVKNTRLGKRFEALETLHAIADEEASSDSLQATDTQGIRSNTLLYVKPEELPTLAAAALVSDYLIYNTATDTYYELESVGVGKNQEAGVVEHVELFLKPTEVAE